MASTLVRGRHVVCRVRSRTEADVVDDGAVFQRDGTIVEVGPLPRAGGEAPGRRGDRLARPRRPARPRQRPPPRRPDAVPARLARPPARAVVRQPDGRPRRRSLPRHALLGVRDDRVRHHDRPAPPRLAGRRRSRGCGPSPTAILQAPTTTSACACRTRTRCATRTGSSTRPTRRSSARLPGRARPRASPPSSAAQAIPLEDHLGLFVDLWEARGRNTGERARIQLAPANLHWCSDDGAGGAARPGRAEYRVGMHMHLVETAYQKEYARRRGGHQRAPGTWRSCGLLGPGPHARARRLADRGRHRAGRRQRAPCSATTPAPTCACAAASRPLNHWTARGVRVALGLDEAGINDDRDMLQEMRLVLRLHRVPGHGRRRARRAADVFRMATEHGAATTPFAGQHRDAGARQGRRRRAARLAAARPSVPRPGTSVVDAVVHRGRAAGVAAVLVAGEVILRDGRFTRVDKAAVARGAGGGAPRPPHGPTRRDAATSRRGLPPRAAVLRRLARRAHPRPLLPPELPRLTAAMLGAFHRVTRFYALLRQFSNPRPWDHCTRGRILSPLPVSLD